MAQRRWGQDWQDFSSGRGCKTLGRLKPPRSRSDAKAYPKTLQHPHGLRRMPFLGKPTGSYHFPARLFVLLGLGTLSSRRHNSTSFWHFSCQHHFARTEVCRRWQFIFWSERGIYVNIPFSFTEWGSSMRRKFANLILTLVVSLGLILSGAAQGRDKKEEKKPEKPRESVVEKDKGKSPQPTPPPKRKPGDN